MPFIAAFVGYTTKLVALQMLYRPIEFVGVGPFGWQGVVPRRAGKTAALTIQMLTDKLIKPEELLEKIDAKQTIEDLREPLTRTIDEMSSRAYGAGAPRPVGFAAGHGPRCRAVPACRPPPRGSPTTFSQR